MTRVKMHWQLVTEADGRKHLDMAWEAAQARVVPSVSLPQIYRKARQKWLRSAIVLTGARVPREAQR